MSFYRGLPENVHIQRLPLFASGRLTLAIEADGMVKAPPAYLSHRVSDRDVSGPAEAAHQR